MIESEPYKKQASLLMRVLPIVAQQDCFALKGGTAINLFFRDMPRLSVDIDLAYLPIKSRNESLTEIDASLKAIAATIERSLPDTKVRSSVLQGTTSIVKLIVRTVDAQIKVEVSPVLRGTVFPPETRTVSEKTQRQFGFAEIAVLSFEDLYGGKLVAALDRQHPRDLFDVRLLFANEGITRELFLAFLIYLISHERPMSEIIAPRLRDISHEFDHGFDGMTTERVTLNELVETRKELVERIKKAFTEKDREFLLSLKRNAPDWQLLELSGVESLPAVRWKIQNLKKLTAEKRAALLEKLNLVLNRE